MLETRQADEIPNDKQKHFNNELKMFVNQKLFDKKLISEEMYWTVKEILIRQEKNF